MKKLIYILTAFLIYSITACNDKLDVNPQQNITPDQIKTANDVKALLFGEYSLWQNGNAFGEGFTFTADLLASEKQVNFVGTFTSYKDLKNKTQNSQNGIASAVWENAYQVINLSNTVIDKINLVNEDERDAIIAEAKFFRGVTFFELLNFYSQPYSMGNTDAANSGIPLMLQPQYSYDSTKAFVSRNTINECYAQIISDLTEAKNKLPEQAENFRATKYSAEAFLARVYLNMADYANAATAANDIISSENFKLTALFNQAFNNDGNSSEDIFAMQQSAQSNAGTGNSGLSTFYCAESSNDINLAPTGRGDAQVANGYLSFFQDDDFRKTFYYKGSSISGISGKYTFKWQKFYKAIPIIRLAEMYLTRGEANLRKGGAPIGGTAPLSDINMVRIRSGADALTTVSPTDFVNERMRELGFEGDRVWTLKRLKMDIDGLSYNDEKLILPIPQREIDVNKNLVQNLGY